MNNEKIILASSSPRRIEMMRKKGFNPIIKPAAIEESLPFSMEKEAAVMYLALKKALDVESKLSSASDQIIIGADTIVYADKIIGKPENKKEAYDILSMLRGRFHYVITGVAVVKANTSVRTVFYETSKVFFKKYSMDQLRDYLDSEEPYDKAGGYAIQGTFSKYIDHFEGDLENIIGFPWFRIEQALRVIESQAQPESP